MLSLHRRAVEKIRDFRNRIRSYNNPKLFDDVEIPENIRKSYCPLPFLHMSVGPSETMRVCCNSGDLGNIERPDGKPYSFQDIDSIDDFFNKSSLARVRQEMLKGERPKECGSCFKHEDSGGTSLRNCFVVSYAHLIKDHIKKTEKDGATEAKIRYVDFALGNNCNIKCRMCNPTDSKLLAKEFASVYTDKIPKYYSVGDFEKASKAWTNVSHYSKVLSELGSTVEKVLMTGGEPFVIKAQYDILDKLIESGRSPYIELVYHTNLTVLPSQLVDRWKQFKKIYVYCSIDGVGEVNDFVRAPSKWATLEKNLHRLIDLRKVCNIQIEVHSVFQAYTLKRTTALLKYLLQFKGDLPCLPFFNYLHIPPHLKVNVLPRFFREQAVHEISKFLDQYREVYLEQGDFREVNSRNLYTLEGHLRRALQSDEEFNYSSFLDFNLKMDKVRGEEFAKVLPELIFSNNDFPSGRKVSVSSGATF